MARFDLTDFEWSVIQPLLPNKPRGVPRVDDRRVLNGIFWRLRTGAPWADIPSRYGSHTTCVNRFNRWRRAGVWDYLLEAVSKAYDGDIQMIDSSSIRVHQHAANGKKNKKNRNGIRIRIIKEKVKTEYGTETIHGRITEQSKLRDAFLKEISFWDEKEKDPRKKLKPKILSKDHPIAVAYRRYKTDWNNIKPVAATYGYYSFLDVWKLLEDNSKFKGIDDSSFQTCRYIYEAQKKHPK